VRRLDIGCVVYGNAAALSNCINAIREHSVTDWRLFLIVNPHPTDTEAAALAADWAARDTRMVHVPLPKNIGYAGGVNKLLLELAETPLVAYLDHDAYVHTHGWDEQMAAMLDANKECGQVYSGAGHYGFHNGRYRECLWSAGYFWMLRRSALEHPRLASGMNTELGHHEEVDLMTRMRLAGYTIGCIPEISVTHDESATRSPESAQRIHDGVVRWMNHWNGYFCGDQLKYCMTAYDPRSLRYTDWNANALFLERMTLHYFPDWNKTPRSVSVPGVGEMDVIEVLKPKGPYAGRAI